MQPDLDAVIFPIQNVIGPGVPHPNFTCAVFTWRDSSLKGGTFQRVVFNLNRQPLDPNRIRQPLRHCPTLEHTILFQTEIKMVRPRVMLLHNESACLIRQRAHFSRLRPLACDFKWNVQAPLGFRVSIFRQSLTTTLTDDN